MCQHKYLPFVKVFLKTHFKCFSGNIKKRQRERGMRSKCAKKYEESGFKPGNFCSISQNNSSSFSTSALIPGISAWAPSPTTHAGSLIRELNATSSSNNQLYLYMSCMRGISDTYMLQPASQLQSFLVIVCSTREELMLHGNSIP